MEHFHTFLMEQGSGSEMQLLFWLAVEDMKSSISNKRACTAKMRRIFKRFFCNNGAEKGRSRQLTSFVWWYMYLMGN